MMIGSAMLLPTTTPFGRGPAPDASPSGRVQGLASFFESLGTPAAPTPLPNASIGSRRCDLSIASPAVPRDMNLALSASPSPEAPAPLRGPAIPVVVEVLTPCVPRSSAVAPAGSTGGSESPPLPRACIGGTSEAQEELGRDGQTNSSVGGQGLEGHKLEDLHDCSWKLKTEEHWKAQSRGVDGSRHVAAPAVSPEEISGLASAILAARRTLAAPLPDFPCVRATDTVGRRRTPSCATSDESTTAEVVADEAEAALEAHREHMVKLASSQSCPSLSAASILGQLLPERRLKRVVFLRHGRSLAQDDPERGRWDPELADCGLSSEGRRQAEQLRMRLAGEGVDLVVCAPLTKVLQTALIAFQDLRCPVVVHPSLAGSKGGPPEMTPRPVEDLVRDEQVARLPRIGAVDFELLGAGWPSTRPCDRPKALVPWLEARPEESVAVVCAFGALQRLMPRVADFPNCLPIRCVLQHGELRLAEA